MKKKIQEYLTYLTAEYIYIPYDKEELLSFIRRCSYWKKQK